MIYFTNLVLGEMLDDKQFEKEVYYYVKNHTGILSICETCLGRIIIKTQRGYNKNIICVCLEVETKKLELETAPKVI